MTQILDCAAADELLPGSTLDALEVDEAIALGAHLRTCDRCRAEVHSLRRAGDALAFYQAAAGGPSPQIKQRLMTQVRVSSLPRTTSSRRWVFRPAAALIPAAIGLILVLGLGAWATSLQSRGTQQQAQIDKLVAWQASIQRFLLNSNLQALPVKFSQAGASAVLYVSNEEVALAVTGLQPVQGESVYQCWWMNDTQEVMPGNAFKTDSSGNGVWLWKRPKDTEYHILAITLENRPGVPRAEGPIVLTANF